MRVRVVGGCRENGVFKGAKSELKQRKKERKDAKAKGKKDFKETPLSREVVRHLYNSDPPLSRRYVPSLPTYLTPPSSDCNRRLRWSGTGRCWTRRRGCSRTSTT
jgi:hypothetical protein